MKTYLWHVWRRQMLVHLPIMACLATGHWRAALVCLAATALVMAYAILSPYTRLFGPVTTQTGRPAVLLTLDDGPDPATTPAILDLLDRHEAKALFFLIGERVERWPELALEIVRRGHEAGNHTRSHPAYWFWSLGPWRTWQEISACQETLTQVLGRAPVWFRAPAGHFNSFVHPALGALNMRLMGWSCRGYDGTGRNVERVLRRISKGLRPGAIVLLHEATPTCLAVVEGTLGMLEARGLLGTGCDARGDGAAVPSPPRRL